jgi:hypothetical protein
MDDDALIAQYIILDPRQPQPDAALVHDGSVAVWALLRDLLAARGNVLHVAARYGFPRDAVLAARAYYLRYAPLIDARIAAEHAQDVAARRAA